MGEMVQFQSNGKEASGYLAVPESGSGPGLIVIQEWWGLVPHIKGVADRFAAEGFVTLAPDLYDGETVAEPDEAGKLMMALEIDKAGKHMGGAIDYLMT
ncbi:MAG: dienelactone hydrolase family protein, partial [Acidimicrobiia bacterium]|nr:dienelactone hydrolase family protein [Acidimicrobiia bacterium]